MKNEYVTGLNSKATIEKKEDKLQSIEVNPLPDLLFLPKTISKIKERYRSDSFRVDPHNQLIPFLTFIMLLLITALLLPNRRLYCGFGQ